MKSNNIIIIILFAIALMASCTKESSDSITPAPVVPGGSNIGPVPTSFTKKVLLEVFTSANNQLSPDGDRILSDIHTTFAGRVFGVGIHANDNMAIGLYNTLDFAFSNNGFPTGMVNRKPSVGNVILNRTQWISNASAQLSGNPVGGVAIDSELSGTTLDITVHAGFRTAVSGDYRLTVYLLEDKVTGTGSGYDQMNFYHTDPSSPFYNMGNPIIGYQHNNVVRETLTADLGDQIGTEALVPGGEHKAQFMVSTANYNNSELRILAFINKVGNSSTTHEVINLQTADAGTYQDWD